MAEKLCSPHVHENSEAGRTCATLPPKAPTPVAGRTGPSVVDPDGALQPSDVVADFVDEDTLPPRQPGTREASNPLDTFPDEAALAAAAPSPVLSPPAADSLASEPAMRDRRRSVFLAWTAVALVAGIAVFVAPRSLVDWTWHRLGGHATESSVTPDLSNTPDRSVSPPAGRVPRTVDPIVAAEPPPLAVDKDREPAASKSSGQSVPSGSMAGQRPPAANATPVGQLGTRIVVEPQSAAVSNVSPGALPTQKPVREPTLQDTVAATSGIEGLELVPVPIAPVPAARSGDVRAPAVPSVRETVSEQDHVRTVLARFQAAYARLDAAAAKELWPSLDHPALERAFRNLQSQELQFHECRLSMGSTSAIATCTGVARYVTRIGNSSWKADAREWTFNLKKESDAWLIESVRMR